MSPVQRSGDWLIPHSVTLGQLGEEKAIDRACGLQYRFFRLLSPRGFDARWNEESLSIRTGDKIASSVKTQKDKWR